VFGVQILNGFSVDNELVDRFGFDSGYIQVSPAPPIPAGIFAQDEPRCC